MGYKKNSFGIYMNYDKNKKTIAKNYFLKLKKLSKSWPFLVIIFVFREIAKSKKKKKSKF